MRLMAGSQGIAALSRSVFMVCLDLESIDHRILIPVKGNLVVSPPPQRFHLVQDKARVHPRIVWDGVADSVTLETLMARSRGRDGLMTLNGLAFHGSVSLVGRSQDERKMKALERAFLHMTALAGGRKELFVSP